MSEEREPVLDSLSDDEFEDVKRRAVKLMSEDERTNLITSVMIWAPRLYRLSRYLLQEEMAKEGIEWAEGIEERIIQAAQMQGNEDAPLDELAQAIHGPVLKLVDEQLLKQAEDKKAEAMRKAVEVEAARLSKPIPLQFLTVNRGSIIVYVGSSEAIATRLKAETVMIEHSWRHDLAAGRDQILTELLLTPVVRKPRAYRKNEIGNLRRIEIGSNKWAWKGNSGTGLQKYLDECKNYLVDGRCDVLTIPDATFLRDKSASMATNASEAIKHLSRWLTSSHAVALLGLPFKSVEEEVIELLRERLGATVTIIDLESTDEN